MMYMASLVDHNEDTCCRVVTRGWVVVVWMSVQDYHHNILGCAIIAVAFRYGVCS